VERVAVSNWNGIERSTGLPYPLWSMAGLRVLARAITDSDAVQVHDFSYFGSLAAARIARSRGVPLLLTQHTGAVRTGSRAFATLYGVGERPIGRGGLGPAAARPRGWGGCGCGWGGGSSLVRGGLWGCC
jgi:hypothetical protein